MKAGLWTLATLLTLASGLAGAALYFGYFAVVLMLLPARS